MLNIVFLCSIGLLGVLGATGTCECSFRRLSLPFTSIPIDTLIRAIGKRAHALHSLVFFSVSCVLGSTAGYASSLESIASEGTF